MNDREIGDAVSDAMMMKSIVEGFLSLALTKAIADRAKVLLSGVNIPHELHPFVVASYEDISAKWSIALSKIPMDDSAIAEGVEDVLRRAAALFTEASDQIAKNRETHRTVLTDIFAGVDLDADEDD